MSSWPYTARDGADKYQGEAIWAGDGWLSLHPDDPGANRWHWAAPADAHILSAWRWAQRHHEPRRALKRLRDEIYEAHERALRAPLFDEVSVYQDGSRIVIEDGDQCCDLRLRRHEATALAERLLKLAAKAPN